MHGAEWQENETLRAEITHLRDAAQRSACSWLACGSSVTPVASRYCLSPNAIPGLTLTFQGASVGGQFPWWSILCFLGSHGDEAACLAPGSGKGRWGVGRETACHSGRTACLCELCAINLTCKHAGQENAELKHLLEQASWRWTLVYSA